MIRRIYSDLPTFKNLEFHEGLNIVLSEKTEGATDRQTRNRAGKTSLVEIIHFLTGASCPAGSLLRHERFVEYYFGIEFDLGNKPVDIRRRPSRPDEIVSIATDTSEWVRQPKENLLGEGILSQKDWIIVLGSLMFGLDLTDAEAEADQDETFQNEKSTSLKSVGLTFRSLYPYFARRKESEGFLLPEKHSNKQQLGNVQMAIMFLLGLDWSIAAQWEQVRIKEKVNKVLLKAWSDTRAGNTDSIPWLKVHGKPADLRTQLILNERRIEQLSAAIGGFQVLPEYSQLESEASELTSEMGHLADENTQDKLMVNDLREATESESPPSYNRLREVYSEAGVVLNDAVIRTFEDVVAFHQSVIVNRKSYLLGQIQEAERRIEQRDREMRVKDRRRSEIMRTLSAHGALDNFVQLSRELTVVQERTEAIRVYLEYATQQEEKKQLYHVERAQLLSRLQQDLREQEDVVREAVLLFQDISVELYGPQARGELVLGESENGPTFKIKIHGGRSTGIRNMQIFCFDMMLMRLCTSRGLGPNYIIHDSHLFDGVDARQVAKALQVGASMATTHGFQYIVMLNSDFIAEREWFADDFNIDQYVVSPRLNDAVESGGLFGFRFN